MEWAARVVLIVCTEIEIPGAKRNKYDRCSSVLAWASRAAQFPRSFRYPRGPLHRLYVFALATSKLLPTHLAMDLINEARAASSPSIAAEGFQQQPRTVRGRSYDFSIHKASELSSTVKRRVWAIFEQNMRDSYVGSSYGWDPRSKKKELFHAESRFILVHQTEAPGLLIAYTMFRFDDEETMEDGVMEPVVYCYEIQIAEEARRSGIGTVLMSDLEAIARKWKMKKVMLTALRSNVDAISFYEKLGFEMDPISPTKVIESRQTQDSAPNDAETTDKEDGWETESEDSFSQVDYEIYSKIV